MTLTARKVARRHFLRGAFAAAGTAAAMPALQGLGFLGLNGRVYAKPGKGGYGRLLPTPDLRDGMARIALPEGFQYRSFSHAGETMSDGHLVPLAHDGMAVYNTRRGKFRLVRNHEDRNAPGTGSTFVDIKNAYDQLAGGGTTTLEINPFTRELERDFISLCGTTVNCAGGATPWNSWVTCEETNAGPPQGWNKQHGYCFDVPVSANGIVPAVPVPDMGRFSHEALAVDPRTWMVYETEDNGGNSGFYRFLSKEPGVLVKGGKLQMLAIVGQPQYDTRTNQKAGVKLPVTWVDIADPNPPGTSATAVFNQGFARGGARFTRLEGCWWGNGAIYFVATNGGNASAGQVWEYRPGDSDDGDDYEEDDREGRRERRDDESAKDGMLKLIYESPSATVLDAPDNLTVSPEGALLLCEDGGGDQYLRGLTLAGEIFDFALNVQTDHEWAGATFAEADPSWNDRKIRGDHRPFGSRSDRVTLFVSRQGNTSGTNPPSPGGEGITFAIWGPWKNGAL